jgi:hypothetical protein
MWIVAAVAVVWLVCRRWPSSALDDTTDDIAGDVLD